LHHDFNLGLQHRLNDINSRRLSKASGMAVKWQKHHPGAGHACKSLNASGNARKTISL